MSKRKWKVYTTDELRDRFQAKPGSNASASDDQKIVVPNLKRRNSAPPGMIHFPPGTFNASNSQNLSSSSHSSSHAYSPTQQQSSPVLTAHHHHQQHELVTHARSSPTNSKAASSVFPYNSSRLEKRRASLPYIPPSSLPNGPPASPAPLSIEAYLTHLQQIPLPSYEDQIDEETPNPPLSPSHPLPSFQSLLQTIREDADEEDSEIREIEERANAPVVAVTGGGGAGGSNGTSNGTTATTGSNSKSLPPAFKDIGISKSPQMTHQHHTHQDHDRQQQQHQRQHQQQQQQPYQPFPNQNQYPFPTIQHQQEPISPSSKFYKNSLTISNEHLPSLSRMSISDILG